MMMMMLNRSFTSNSTMSSSPNPILIFFLLPLFLLVLLTFLIIYRTLFTDQAPRMLPPGPTPWPFVGNLPELITNRPTFRWIHGLLQELNTEIACVILGNVHIIPVISPEISREFLKTHDAVFASRPVTMVSDRLSGGFQTTALSPWGEQWKKMRRVIASEVVKPARHTWLLPKRAEEADNLIGFIYNVHCRQSSAAAVNVRAACRQYTGNVARKMIFGTRYFGKGRKDGGPGFEEEEHVDALFTSLAHLYSFSPSDYLPYLKVLDLDGHEKVIKGAIAILNKYHNPIIDERIAKWRNGKRKEMEDLLDVLITLNNSKGEPLLSLQEIKAQIIELMIEMVDNPANSIEWAMAEMINQPEIMQKVVEEIDRVVGKDRLVQESDIPQLKYVKACARESLRLHPITPFNVPHVSMADAVVGGYFIPKGSHVLLSRLGLGRNPRVWEDPLRFKPKRHMNEDVVELTETELRFISFTRGRRGCPGAALGTVMTIMLLARLVQGFSWCVPPNQEEIDLKESTDDLSLAKPLYAHAKPRLCASIYEINVGNICLQNSSFIPPASAP